MAVVLNHPDQPRKPLDEQSTQSPFEYAGCRRRGCNKNVECGRCHHCGVECMSREEEAEEGVNHL